MRPQYSFVKLLATMPRQHRNFSLSRKMDSGMKFWIYIVIQIDNIHHPWKSALEKKIRISNFQYFLITPTQGKFFHVTISETHSQSLLLLFLEQLTHCLLSLPWNHKETFFFPLSSSSTSSSKPFPFLYPFYILLAYKTICTYCTV